MKFDLVRRTLVVAGGASIVSGLELLLMLLLVRWLSPAVWNEVAVMLMIYGTCKGLGQLSIQEGVYFFYTELPRSERRRLVIQTALMLAVSAVLMAAGILSLGRWLPAITPAIEQTLPILALAVLFELPASCTPQVLIAAERPGWATGFRSATSVAQMVCVGLPLVFGSELWALACGLLAASCLRFLGFLILVGRAVPAGSLRPDLTLVWRQLAYTAPLALSVASGVLNRYIDKWIVSVFEPDHVGAYTFAANELPFITSVGYAMASVLSTRVVFAFGQGKTDVAYRYWIAACSRGALVVGPITVLVLLLAPEVIALAFDPTYRVALLPFQLYNLILLHRVMGYGMVLRSAGKTKTLWALSLTLLGLNTGLSLPLTWAYGITGAALGTLLATAGVFVVTLVVIARVLDTRFTRVFPWRSYGRLLGVTGGAAALATWAASLTGSPALGLGAKLVVFVPLALGGGWLLQLHRRLPPVPEDSPEFQDAIAEAPKDS